MTISSTMVARVTSLPHGVDPSYMRYQAHDVRSIVNPGDEIFDAKPVPWWIYLLAALGGLLLLLLVIYALYKVRVHSFFLYEERSKLAWKQISISLIRRSFIFNYVLLLQCGFFKRKRPKHSNGSGPGREPLNGYDPSDTAL